MKQLLSQTFHSICTLLLLLPVAAALTTGLTGCASSGGGGGRSTQDILKGPYYYEYEQDGHYYLIGRPATAVDFEAKTSLPSSETRKGAGPTGEDVIIEVDQADPSLEAYLWKRFQEEHLYYAEEVRNSSIYVFGKEESQSAFLKSGEFSDSRTLDGAGPTGENVLIETDPENQALTGRLEAEFKARHKP